ncbi:MAG: M14 family metallopeptidase, partial [Rikenellaceae bacterium]
MIKEVVSVALPLDEQLLIRKNSISSGSSKKRVCIVTGTHGDELEGQYVCFKLGNLLRDNLDKLDGTVEIYPALNPLGIDTISRGIPGFDLDMNRIFPGQRDGVMAESVAHYILEDLKGADMVIDIHSSNIFLREMPQVRINVDSAASLVPTAQLLGVDFIWIHEAATVLEATLAHSLNSTGTPCVVVEMGVGMRINHSLGNNLVEGVLNLLESMGMWSGKVNRSELKEGVIS